MRLVDQLKRNLGFTPRERRIVLFLLAVFLLGIGAKIFKSEWAGRAGFDYAASDSEFEARSRIPDSIDSIDTSGAGSAPGSDSAGRAPRKSGSSIHLSPRSININTASKDELTRLPGIGDATAERILAYRDENGSFSSIAELVNVRGIGKKKLDLIAPYCTLGR